MEFSQVRWLGDAVGSYLILNQVMNFALFQCEIVVFLILRRISANVELPMFEISTVTFLYYLLTWRYVMTTWELSLNFFKLLQREILENESHRRRFSKDWYKIFLACYGDSGL